MFEKPVTTIYLDIYGPTGFQTLSSFKVGHPKRSPVGISAPARFASQPLPSLRGSWCLTSRQDYLGSDFVDCEFHLSLS